MTPFLKCTRTESDMNSANRVPDFNTTAFLPFSYSTGGLWQTRVLLFLHYESGSQNEVCHHLNIVTSYMLPRRNSCSCWKKHDSLVRREENGWSSKWMCVRVLLMNTSMPACRYFYWFLLPSVIMSLVVLSLINIRQKAFDETLTWGWGRNWRWIVRPDDVLNLWSDQSSAPSSG